MLQQQQREKESQNNAINFPKLKKRPRLGQELQSIEVPSQHRYAHALRSRCKIFEIFFHGMKQTAPPKYKVVKNK